jgi:hypothetical protein
MNPNEDGMPVAANDPASGIDVVHHEVESIVVSDVPKDLNKIDPEKSKANLAARAAVKNA